MSHRAKQCHKKGTLKKAILRGGLACLLFTAAYTRGDGQDRTLAEALKTSYEAEVNGDYQAAIKPLTALGASVGSSYLAQVRLGWLNYCAKDWQQSIAYYGKASKLTPFAIEPLLGLMLAQQAAGNNDEALRTAQVALRQDPGNYTALSHTAWLLYLKRDFRQAAFMYHKLVNLYPTDTEMLLGLGFSLKFAGDKKESAQTFNTVLLLSPGNARALEGLRDDIGKQSGDRPVPPQARQRPQNQR